MSEEQGSREPEDRSEYRNPTHIAETSKSADQDYQWFRKKEDEPGSWPWRNPIAMRWSEVTRADMPTEPSDHEAFIQRNEVRLYKRPKSVSDEERNKDISRALDQLRINEDRRHQGITQIIGAVSTAHQSYQPFERRRLLKNRLEDGPRPWYGAAATRGRVFVLHESALSPRQHRFAARFWRILARHRIVLLSHDESEMAERQGTSYGTWAWAKIDLLREGVFDYRRNYPRYPRYSRPRRQPWLRKSMKNACQAVVKISRLTRSFLISMLERK